MVDVDGRRLSLSNLDKVLYPATGTVKAEVIDYYTRVSSALLPYVHRRPATFTRWPDGTAGKSFFEKNAPSHRPDWVPTVRLPSPGSGLNRDTIDYVLVEDLPTLVWAANLAALEIHVPQWRVVGDQPGQERVGDCDLLVFDLDPGPPASVVECAQVALKLREGLASFGLEGWPKTSGSKGMQVYVPVAPTSGEATSSFARTLAQELEGRHPDLVVSRMPRALRTGKVFVDWSQNNAAKTTVAPYSLRAREQPTVSTPIHWDEVAQCRELRDLRFVSTDVLTRLDRQGDLLAGLLTADRPVLPG